MTGREPPPPPRTNTAPATPTRTCTCGTTITAATTWLCPQCQTQLAHDYDTAATILATTRDDTPALGAGLDQLATMLWRWDLDAGITRPTAMSTPALRVLRRTRLRAVTRDMRSPELARALHLDLAALTPTGPR
jgi:hypothetical protein